MVRRRSPEPSEAKVAWKGETSNAQADGKKVRLYLATWQNPKPDPEVKSIDISSTNEPACEPMCLAIIRAEVAQRDHLSRRGASQQIG